MRSITGALALLAPSATQQASAQSAAYAEKRGFYLCGQLNAMFKVPSWHWCCGPDIMASTVTLMVDHKIPPAKLCADVTRLVRRMNVGMVGWTLIVKSPTNQSRPGITCAINNPS